MQRRVWLNACILMLCLALAIGLTGWLETRTPSAPISRQTELQSAPDFSFYDIEGQPHRLSDYNGKIVILNFWASWCAPCFVEFPILLDVVSKQKDAVLIALSIDKNPAEAKKFFTRFDKKIQKQINDQAVIIGLDRESKISQDLFHVFKVPETILIDARQKQRKKFVGASFDRQLLRRAIDELK